MAAVPTGLRKGTESGSGCDSGHTFSDAARDAMYKARFGWEEFGSVAL